MGRAGGFSLVEMIVALAVLTIISAALIFSFNFNKSKGQVLFSLVHSVGDAAERFAVDTSCYPYDTALLFQQSLAATDTNNSCGAAVGAQWNGPYMKTMPVDANNNVLVTQIGPQVTLSINDIGQALTNGAPNQYAVLANNVPDAIAKQAYTACGGSTSNCVLVAGTGTPPLDTFEYVFAQTQ
jgi:prepilin-type N-terminal cleavage/methylation domain-containing protein